MMDGVWALPSSAQAPVLGGEGCERSGRGVPRQRDPSATGQTQCFDAHPAWGLVPWPAQTKLALRSFRI